jgi:putative peptidoglycan lipid II flippase
LPWVDDTSRGRMLSRVGAAQAALYEDEDGPEEQIPPRERIKSFLTSAFPRNGMVLAVLFVAGAFVALLRDKVLAHTFGAGPELDAFFTALILPQLILEFLVIGGVVGPFLPLFVGLQGEAEATARAFARTVLTGAVIVMAIAMGVIFIFAWQTAAFMAPGYVGAERVLYANLLRIMCLGQIVFAASFVLGEVLVAERRFITYGVADLLYNAGIVAGALVLSGPFGIYGAAIGVLIGASAHLGVRLFGIYRTKFRPGISLAFRTKGIGEFIRLSLPKMVSQPMGTLMLAYFASLCSTLAPGSATSFSFARNFQSVGESMVGLAFATAAFPALSAAAAAGDKRAFKKTFTTSLATIGVLSTGVGIGLLVFGGFAIQFLLSGGAFDSYDVSRTSMILAILAISVPFESLVELFARAIFATHNTVEPTIAAAAGFAFGIGTTWILSPVLGLAAIPIGYTACRVVQLVVLASALKPRMARIGGSSRWSRALVHDRWGGMASPERRATPTTQLALVAILLVALAGGTIFTAAQAFTGSSVAAAPQITGRPVEPGARSSIVLPQASGAKSPGASSSGPLPSAPSASSSQFSMDLYRDGDFVSESKDTWCVAAAMQTSENMMSSVVDTSHDRQAQLFDLAVSMAGESNGGADPDGWAAGLSYLGYGRFQTGANATLVGAVHTVAKQIRLTNRPGGLIVWKGWHSWVMSGFTATADPALTDDFTVLSVFIEDVWYPRVSTLWPKSRAPDAEVKVTALPPDYVPWQQGKVYADRQGLYVYVIPEV